MEINEVIAIIKEFFNAIISVFKSLKDLFGAVSSEDGKGDADADADKT